MAYKSYNINLIPTAAPNQGNPFITWSWAEESDQSSHTSRAIQLSDALAAYICVRLLSHIPFMTNFQMSQEQLWPGMGTTANDIDAAAEVHAQDLQTWLRVQRLQNRSYGPDVTVMAFDGKTNATGWCCVTLAHLGYVVEDDAEWTHLESLLAQGAELLAVIMSDLSIYAPKDARLTISKDGTNPEWGWKFTLKSLLANGETQESTVSAIPLMIRLLDALTRPFTPWQGTNVPFGQFKLGWSLGEREARVITSEASSYSPQRDSIPVGDECMLKASNAAQTLFMRPGNGSEWSLVPYWTLKANRDEQLYPNGWQGINAYSGFAEWWNSVKPSHSDIWATFITAIYYSNVRQYHRTFKLGGTAASADITPILTAISGLDSRVEDIGQGVTTANAAISYAKQSIESAIGGARQDVLDALGTIVIDPSTLEPPQWLVNRLKVLEAIGLWINLPVVKNGKVNRSLLKWIDAYTNRSADDADQTALEPADNKCAFKSVNKER